MDIIMDGLKPFQYSILFYKNNETKIKLGVLVFDPETKEYLFRQMDAGIRFADFADNTHRAVVEDFLLDIPSLELVYEPVIGSSLEKYESWIEAVSGELKGIIRFSKVNSGLTLSLEEALSILVGVEMGQG